MGWTRSERGGGARLLEPRGAAVRLPDELPLDVGAIRRLSRPAATRLAGARAGGASARRAGPASGLWIGKHLLGVRLELREALDDLHERREDAVDLREKIKMINFRTIHRINVSPIR
jgi:hypothetical protein